MPTPAPLSVGIISGVTLLIPLVFCRISISLLPRVTLNAKSSTTLFVLPSTTINFGGILNPLPKEVIPIDSTEARESILIVCGNKTLGFKVLSEG